MFYRIRKHFDKASCCHVMSFVSVPVKALAITVSVDILPVGTLTTLPPLFSFTVLGVGPAL